MTNGAPRPAAPAPNGNGRPPLLEIRNLEVVFAIEGRTARAVDGVDLRIDENEVFGLVGESGCGKSVTALSIMRLVPDPPGKIAGGEILFRGRDLLRLPYDAMRRIRGHEIGMIFQEPMTALNPVFSVGWQLGEAVRQHSPGLSRREIGGRVCAMLERVGIPDPRRHRGSFPHELSGGMRQRVLIAMALAMEPLLLIADEPTTALDATIQAQILELMLDLKKRSRGMAMILVTHNLAVVAQTCERVAVMYGGAIQEVAPVRPLFRKPFHPYTRALLRSLPRPDLGQRRRLDAIPGAVPSILDFPAGCKFWTRCAEKIEPCARVEPGLIEIEPGRWCRCHLVKPPAARRGENTQDTEAAP
jgi:peptide/nickel transport system ATP-binding protein